MAPSSRLTLISPLRVWLIFNALFVALVASGWYASYRVAEADNQRLISTEASTLTKARFDDIQNRRFRDFVEGAGRNFNDLYIRLEVGKDAFQFGSLPDQRNCSETIYPLTGETGQARVTMCRPLPFSSGPLVILLAAFLLVSGLSLTIVQRLEKRTTLSLASFLRDSGVEVKTEHGLIGILSEFREIRARLDMAKEQERAAIDAKARSALAEQVAHDIRSPLAALDSAAGSVAHLPDDQRHIVQAAVGRIRDIANHLLDTARPAPSEAAHATESRVHLLSNLIDPIITEKRLEFRSHSGIEITARLDAASYGHFGEVEPAEFKRVLSNLISNGVEALYGKGTVTVSLSRTAGTVEVKVQDDGRGIPPDVLARLGRRGETHGKPGGSGLGLYYAKTCAEAWGGSLAIFSEEGKGTSVLIRLPAAAPPPWFVSDLELAANSAVVVLDDDTAIHHIWQRRFEAPAIRGVGIEALYFTRTDELRRWVGENPDRAGKALYLLDYELRGSADTGLTLAEELCLGSRAILVTGRSEEKDVVDGCLRINVRTMPKGLAGFVPISCLGSSQPDAVLLDDDQLVHSVWRVAARTSGKTLDTYSTPKEFLSTVAQLDKNTPIYLDSHLSDGIRGEHLAKDLHARGYRNLYLATGNSDSISLTPWIKGVVGKHAPWDSGYKS